MEDVFIFVYHMERQGVQLHFLREGESVHTSACVSLSLSATPVIISLCPCYRDRPVVGAESMHGVLA